MLARPLLIPTFRPSRSLQTELPRQMASLCIRPFQTLPTSNEDLTALNGLTAVSPPTPESLMTFTHRLLFTKCSRQGACGLSLSASLDSSFTHCQSLTALHPNTPLLNLQTCSTISSLFSCPDSIFVPDKTLTRLQCSTQTFWIFSLKLEVILPPPCFQKTRCLSSSDSSCTFRLMR